MTTTAIWPTWIYTNTVENHEEIYQAFLPYLNDPDNFDSPWTYGSCLSSIRNSNNDSFPWKLWFESIDPYVHDHLQSLEPTMPYNVHSDEYWANIYFKGDFQEIHDHAFPGRSLSAIYIMEVPENQKGGELVFECQNFDLVKFSGLNRLFDKWQYQHIMPVLSPGNLILFPSWLNHYVLPLHSDERRITLAANFNITEGFANGTT